MAENKLDLVSVRQLLGMKFFIPIYQRGYRWTDDQVKDLLSDIRDFSQVKRQDYEFYCVQPLVVRKMSEEDRVINRLPTEQVWYEVIDGQQRLTTIYLILSVCRGTITSINRNQPLDLFEIRYQREANTPYADASYLNSGTDFTYQDDTSIDHYYISNAYHTIQDWIDEQDEEFDMVDFTKAFITHRTDDDGRDRANNVRFIWYETTEQDPIKVFTRLNIGKIGLTNAELIRALILNRSNFVQQSDDHIKLRQQEIGSEWDQIEYTLQNDEFWMFLNNNVAYKNPTRIDFIFDLICKSNVLLIDEEDYAKIGTDRNRTFRYFYAYFQHQDKRHDLYACWHTIKQYFQTFKDWFDDIAFYHYIGFLVACEAVSIDDLIREWQDDKERSTFLAALKRKVKAVIGRYPLDYQYREDGSDKTVCKPILLFHNIQTVIDQNAYLQNNYKCGVFYKFPFHLFKREGWDVEHINSNTTNDEHDINTQKEWLVNVYLSVDEQTRKEISECFGNGSIGAVYDKVKALVSTQDDWSPEDKNRIWNYTLLDSSTNRSYGNAIFSAKRRVIISKDKGVIMDVPRFTREKKGIVMSEQPKEYSSFVPPCTKHVFLKYYSSTMGDGNYWTKSDAQSYLDDICRCVNQLD